MLIFVLLTEKSLVVSFWTFFKFLGNQGELERTETTKKFCWCKGIFLNSSFPLKVCLCRTRPRLGGVREGMVEIKQTKVVYTERIQSANAEHDFSLFYLEKRRKPRSRSRSV